MLRCNSLFASQHPQPGDQPGGGRVLAGLRLFAPDYGEQQARQLLAQFHAPLVEGIDAPHHTLHEHLVLEERNEAAQGKWGERPVPSSLLGGLLKKQETDQEKLYWIDIGATILGLNKKYRQAGWSDPQTEASDRNLRDFVNEYHAGAALSSAK